MVQDPGHVVEGGAVLDDQSVPLNSSSPSNSGSSPDSKTSSPSTVTKQQLKELKSRKIVNQKVEQIEKNTRKAEDSPSTLLSSKAVRKVSRTDEDNHNAQDVKKTLFKQSDDKDESPPKPVKTRKSKNKNNKNK